MKKPQWVAVIQRGEDGLVGAVDVVPFELLDAFPLVKWVRCCTRKT